MSFTKRNTVLSAPRATHTTVQAKTETQLAPGVRPSPLDGRLTTSTGTASLDQLLAGYGGLPLGTCLLVEEQGTTDFSGVLLRYYAAEGLVQGHHVHALGFPPEWGRQLPALAEPDKKSKSAQPAPPPEEKMKIAWRYESLGNGSNVGAAARGDSSTTAIFCHSFDLTKRLITPSCKGTLQMTPTTGPPTLDRAISSSESSPFKLIIKHLQAKLEASPPTVIHRLIIPSLMSPSLYASGCSRPSEILQFLHAVRALLRQYNTSLTALITLPTSLFPRSSGLIRWIELLCDGVVELIPLPASPAATAPPSSSDRANPRAGDQPQGLLRVHTLPVYHEKGGGGAETGSFRENLSFSLSASKGLQIKPYSLPPMEEEEKKEKSPASAIKDGLEF
ncbi:Elongator complex protein 4 [Bombardia bombarda]|uniref:Elongator complex protein 4 n=1 Tax=Bombardia bombarda TaxID=252184 RepID=A0AA39X9R2_9PEZI|nr:Elongator complex protein 4 [Bombardia bombarda]